ncbi:phosphatidate cytidylyltransferase [Candidatus Sumerlaeota bacterium]|nr:phosphatidate cytidylyltransferase [Candidatus Sumerlaeota bacterium]
MLVGRNVSSALFFAVMVGCVLWDVFTRFHVFPILVFLVSSLAILEATALVRKTGAEMRPWRLGCWALVMMFVFDGWLGEMQHLHVIVIVGLMLLFVQAMTQPIRGGIGSVGTALMCSVWIGVGFGSILTLWSWDGPQGISREGRYLIVFLMPVAMFQDIAAMWTGSLLGRRKLAPVLSPHKTVEGAIGGLLGSGLMGLVLWFIYSFFKDDTRGVPLCEFFTWWDALLLGLLFGGVGQLGDLSESLLKREAGVKDSGWTGTAHGGVLDVFDSLLFCAPTMALYAWTRGLWMFSG